MARAIVCPGNLAVLTFTTHRQTADAQRLVPEGYQSLRLSVDKGWPEGRCAKLIPFLTVVSRTHPLFLASLRFIRAREA